MSALSNWEAQKEAEHFRTLDMADVMEAAIDERIADIATDIELGRGTVAVDVVSYVNGDALEDALVKIARHLMEKDRRLDSRIEKLIRGVIDKAIVDYATAKIARATGANHAD